MDSALGRNLNTLSKRSLKTRIYLSVLYYMLSKCSCTYLELESRSGVKLLNWSSPCAIYCIRTLEMWSLKSRVRCWRLWRTLTNLFFYLFFLFWNLLFRSRECRAPASTFPPEIERVLDFTELTRSAALHRSYPQWWHSSTFILGEDGEAHRSSMCVGGARCCRTAVQLALARAQLKHMVGTKGVHCASLGQKHVMFQFDLNSTFNSCSRAFDLFQEEWAAFHPQTIISKPSGPWGLNGVKTL